MTRTDDGAPVVVGYDGSKPSERALRWAVQEARHRWTSLIVCHAWHWPYPVRPSDPSALDTIRMVAQGILDQGVYQAARLAPSLPVHARLIAGPAAAALVSESHGAGLLVLGTRGFGGFTDLRVGSAAVQVPAHAACPVIVVGRPDPSRRPTPGLVVVGVDGSPAAEAAVGFAAEEAVLRDGSLHAVCSWWDTGGYDAAPPPNTPPGTPFPDAERLKRRAAAHFQETVALWSEKFPDLRIEASFMERSPRQALREAAAHAELLVVGDRGIGASNGPPLGPVTQAMLHHSPCPVAVVHGGRAH
ncbi:universal stress protein [Thermopolyspora sp. NPDC052614]|uniref:universal stress protein n=1 Tax=Thermopolyspora sp. NPDC052614 TaxID=3155682 RepID=UPI00342494EE